MNALGVAITVVAALMVMLGSRRIAILGVVISVCYITQGQQLDVGGFHFTAVRLVLLVGFIRAIVRGELFRLKLSNLDWVMFIYVIFAPMMTGLRTGVWQ